MNDEVYNISDKRFYLSKSEVDLLLSGLHPDMTLEYSGDNFKLNITMVGEYSEQLIGLLDIEGVHIEVFPINLKNNNFGIKDELGNFYIVDETDERYKELLIRIHAMFVTFSKNLVEEMQRVPGTCGPVLSDECKIIFYNDRLALNGELVNYLFHLVFSHEDITDYHIPLCATIPARFDNTGEESTLYFNIMFNSFTDKSRDALINFTVTHDVVETHQLATGVVNRFYTTNDDNPILIKELHSLLINLNEVNHAKSREEKPMNTKTFKFKFNPKFIFNQMMNKSPLLNIVTLTTEINAIYNTDGKCVAYKFGVVNNSNTVIFTVNSRGLRVSGTDDNRTRMYHTPVLLSITSTPIDFTVSYLVSVIDMINNIDLDFINGEEGDSCGCGPNCKRCEEDASDYDEELYEALRGR